jgi:hypothetical protein
MSAIGPKQTWASAPHMSAFGGKADIPIGSDNRVYRILRPGYALPSREKQSIYARDALLTAERLFRLVCQLIRPVAVASREV